jgi:DNA gyrase subunit A
VPDDVASSSDRSDWEREALVARLEFLEAVLAAFDRRAEVIEVTAESASADEARAALCALLGISEAAATAVLDLQVRRFAKHERGRISADRDSVRRDLGR